MARPFIKVSGDKKLIKKLKELGNPKLAKRILKKAINAAARQVVKAARQNIESDTGALKKSITSKVVGKSFRYTAIIGADTAVVSEDGGKPSNYDHLVEYGFQHPNGTTVPGRSFLRKGFESAAPAAQKMLEDKIAKEIEKAATKGGK